MPRAKGKKVLLQAHTVVQKGKREQLHGATNVVVCLTSSMSTDKLVKHISCELHTSHKEHMVFDAKEEVARSSRPNGGIVFHPVVHSADGGSDEDDDDDPEDTGTFAWPDGLPRISIADVIEEGKKMSVTASTICI